MPAYSLINKWKSAFCVSKWCGGLGQRVQRKQRGETFCLVCAARWQEASTAKTVLVMGSEGTKQLETSGNADHCLEKLITTENSSLLSETVGLWGLWVLGGCWGWGGSRERYLLCWTPCGTMRWHLGCWKPAVLRPSVCPGSTFPFYLIGWNLILENASLKLIESLLGQVRADRCRKF